MFLLASKSKSEALFKVTPDNDTQVQTLSHLVTISKAFLKLQYSLLDPQNTIRVYYTESDVNKLVENTSIFSLKFTSHSVNNSMEETPLEANRFSASKEIPRILGCPMCHYHIYKCPPPVHIVSQLVSFHAPRSHFLNINLKISLPSKPFSSNWSK